MQTYYKTPKFWVSVIAIIALVAVACILLCSKGALDRDDECNVAKINLHGELYTYTLAYPGGDASTSDGKSYVDEASSEDIVSAIDAAKDDSSIKGVLLDVDSPGGSPVAGEEIANALKRFSDSGKISVSQIRDMGDSAAYWASTGASHVIASANSSVGDIGVTSSYVANAEQNSDQGLTFEQISIGKYKDAGNPNAPLSADAKAIFLKNDQEVYDNFVTTVAANRGLSEATVRTLADGSDMTGDAALKAGLVDELGDRETARKYFTEKVGEDAVICNY